MMKYIKGFDSIRAIGCFFVIVAHWGVWFNDSTQTGKFFKYIVLQDGRLFVNFFFVLSGFLITSILLRAKKANDDKGSVHILKSYLVRRGLRIYPLYYLLLIFLYLVNFPDVRQNIIYFATYTSNLLIYRTGVWNQFCVTWTLSIEEQLYLLWPLFILFIKDKYLKWIFIVSIVIGVVSTYITMGLEHHIAPALVYNCLDVFGIGSLFAYIRINNYKVAQFERLIKVCVVFCIAAYFYWRFCLFLDRPPKMLWIAKTTDSIIATWFMIVVINNRSELLRKYFFENRYLNFIGKMSYGIYLFHDVYDNGFMIHVNNFFNRASRGYPGINAIIMNHHYNYWIHIAIVLSLSAGAYLLVEKPLLNLKKIFTYNKAPVAIAA